MSSASRVIHLMEELVLRQKRPFRKWVGGEERIREGWVSNRKEKDLYTWTHVYPSSLNILLHPSERLHDI